MKLIYIPFFIFSVFAFGQNVLEFNGVVKDKKTETTIENAIVMAQPSRISKAGYYSGVKTEKNGVFNVRSTFDLPLYLVVTKLGCKTKRIKIKKDGEFFEIILKCNSETIEKINEKRDSDDDNDGVINYEDECPNEAGEKENNGCPLPDSDKDGIDDKDDTCPDIVGPKSNNGCPWPDTDNDGIIDKDDECPNEIGVKSNNGCPETPIELIGLINNQSSSILFKVDSHDINIYENSFLNELVELLKQSPKLELIIEGHASSDGSISYNQRLSEERAESVKQFLIEKGVRETRLSTIGYGEKRPKSNNNTKEGRSINRRVEFTLKNDWFVFLKNLDLQAVKRNSLAAFF